MLADLQDVTATPCVIATSNVLPSWYSTSAKDMMESIAVIYHAGHWCDLSLTIEVLC